MSTPPDEPDPRDRETGQPPAPPPPVSPWARPAAGSPQEGPPGLGGEPGYGTRPDGPPGLGGQPGYGPPPYGPPGVPTGLGPPAQPAPGYGAPYPGPGPGHPPGQGGGYPPGPGHPPYGGLPPYAQPGPSRRSNRRVLALVTGLAVAAIVLVVVVATFVFRGSPRETADAFMAALQAKDIDRAHSMLCKDGQQKESKQELRRVFDLDDRSITGYRLGTERTRQREGKEETLIPVTISYDQGAEVRVDLGIWNEGGQKICSLNPPDSG